MSYGDLFWLKDSQGDIHLTSRHSLDYPNAVFWRKLKEGFAFYRMIFAYLFIYGTECKRQKRGRNVLQLITVFPVN